MVVRRKYAIWLYEMHNCSSHALFRLLDRKGDVNPLLFNGALQQLIGEQHPLTALSQESFNSFWEERERVHPSDIATVTFWDEHYPEILREIYNPPIILYMAGNLDLLDRPLTIGIIGARNPSVYGKKVAYSFAKELAEVGVCIVSGFAMGIDACAHAGAVEVGDTIAVLGCGIDINYPVVNTKLRKQVLEKGLMISEFPLGTKAKNFHFPMRNRIISGLSKGVVIVEAALKSGSLITAKLALDQNRDVFAVPGEIYKGKSQGSNQLIRSGATLIMSSNDILNFYDINRYSKQIKPKLSGEQEMVYNLILSNGAMHFDAIFDHLSIEMGLLMMILFDLELKNVLAQDFGGTYSLKKV